MAVGGAVGGNFPDDLFRGIALPEVTDRVRPVTFRLRTWRFFMDASWCSWTPMICRSGFRGNVFYLEIRPAVDRFRQCSRRQRHWEVLLVLLVVETGKPEDAGRVGGRWIAAKPLGQSPQQLFGLVLRDILDPPHHLVLGRGSMKHIRS